LRRNFELLYCEMATGSESHATTPHELQSVKQRRSKFQGWVTRIVNEARICLSQPQPHREQVIGVMNNLKARYEKYKTVSEQLIDLLVEDGEVSALIEDMTAFDNDVETLLVSLQSHVNCPVEPNHDTVHNRPVAKAKLPKLELKKFNGDPLMWPEFWDLYDVAIHTNSDVPIVQKFAHLKSLLIGEAAKCIASIATTEANYSTAVDRLQNRNGKKEAQRHRLMAKLTEMRNLENY